MTKEELALIYNRWMNAASVCGDERLAWLKDALCDVPRLTETVADLQQQLAAAQKRIAEAYDRAYLDEWLKEREAAGE